jgi:hypothetical protein
MSRGAEFGQIQPLVARNGPIQVAPALVLPAESFGAGAAINTAFITPVTPLNSFRIGQQIFFWLGVVPGVAGGAWASRVRLKLWWVRPNKEYRAPGFPKWEQIDRATFGDGPVILPADPVANNRYVWIPSPKRFDITPFQTPPPAAPPLPNSDSVLLDDCLVMDLPDPNDPAYVALFPAPQVVSRWDSFFYPAMGYALGMTWDADGGGGGPAPQELTISLTWQVGTLGGTNYQESIG